MNLLFIADPLATFKTYKDTTYAMMREAAKRGHKLHHTLAGELSVQNGKVVAHAAPFQFIGAKDDHDHEWFKPQDKVQAALNDFDAVIMRTDPPFDMQYLYSTQLLTLAEQQGAKVFNSGQAMRDFNEKLAILNFARFTAPTLVSTRAADVRAFLAEHGDIIVKPLDGMGGMGIFRLTERDPNIGSILETLMRLDTRTIMAQRYIPEIVHGDKRILVIDGEVVPFALARIPQQGETRGNLAAGGRGVAQELSERDREIAETLAPELKRRGMLLAGLDVIGENLTEVNVTSPTGFQEITKQKSSTRWNATRHSFQAACTFNRMRENWRKENFSQMKIMGLFMKTISSFVFAICLLLAACGETENVAQHIPQTSKPVMESDDNLVASPINNEVMHIMDMDYASYVSAANTLLKNNKTGLKIPNHIHPTPNANGGKNMLYDLDDGLTLLIDTNAEDKLQNVRIVFDPDKNPNKNTSLRQGAAILLAALAPNDKTMLRDVEAQMDKAVSSDQAHEFVRYGNAYKIVSTHLPSIVLTARAE